MIPLVVIRPEPGNSATVEAARALGLAAKGFALFDIAPSAWRLPDAPCDALLIGSANALRHGGPQLEKLRGLPVYAVGETTAAAAQAAGFVVAGIGEDGLQPLLAQVTPDHGRLLRLCGKDRVPLTPPPGVTLTDAVVYASEPGPLPEALRQLLKAPTVVALHSASAADHFAAQCTAHAIARDTITLVAIGPRVADAAGAGWAAVRSAETPTDAALLALARAVCQTPPSSRGQGPIASNAR